MQRTGIVAAVMLWGCGGAEFTGLGAARLVDAGAESTELELDAGGAREQLDAAGAGDGDVSRDVRPAMTLDGAAGDAGDAGELADAHDEIDAPAACSASGCAACGSAVQQACCTALGACGCMFLGSTVCTARQ